ncbi:hypothetical protein OC861_000176 [Tilletia horrida]|nr:hypothetical protein OC845_000167 [Tilletia horrida]KAK0570226.1 hypothetical protein OC861_000176 [Tilletia horrida]
MTLRPQGLPQNLSSWVPLIIHCSCLFLVLLVLVSPSPFPYGPSLIKITSASVNTTQAPSAGPPSNFTSSGVNITLSNVSVAEVKPSVLSKRRLVKHVIREAAPASAGNGTTPVNSSAPPPGNTPAVEPTPADAAASTPTSVARPAPSNTNAFQTTTTSTSSGTTRIKLSIGPLGSCFWSSAGIRQCTGATLDPHFNLSALTLGTQNTISISGLPDSMGGSTRSNILLAAVIVLLITTSLAAVPCLASQWPDSFGFLLEPGSAESAYRSLRKFSIWALAVIFVLLMGAAVSLRFTYSSAVTAFNAVNQHSPLPTALTEDGDGVNVGLQAQTGNSFGLLWIASFGLAFLFWMERRRAAQAEAVALARLQLDAEEARRNKRTEATKQAPADKLSTDVNASPGDGHREAQSKAGPRSWVHSKAESISSSVGIDAQRKPHLRRKQEHDSWSAIGRPMPSKLAPDTKPLEDTIRLDASPSLRHQVIALQPVPGRRFDPPQYSSEVGAETKLYF